jgi:glycosyltransferase involved in cell wall biosynthesis
MVDTVAGLTPWAKHIVLVDDGSAPEYHPLFAEAEKYGCVLLRHESNRGKGAALKTAFDWLARNCPEEPVVCADSDGQHYIGDILSIARAVVPGSCVIVLGSRYFDKTTPLRSRMGNGATRAIFRAITGTRLYDTQTGLRGYPPELMPWLRSIDGDRFEYEYNVLLHVAKANMKIREIPINTLYKDRNKGTHFRTFRDAAPICRCIWRHIRKK